MNEQREHIVVCGKINPGRKFKNSDKYRIHNFSSDPGQKGRNVNIALPHFVRIVGCHFPDRIKDLLEIAGYLYASDRMIDRGSSQAVEYHKWSRKFHYIIKVRDLSFWNKKEVKEALSKALTFMTGDHYYEFTFMSGGKDTGQTSLTDQPEFNFEKTENSHICLFSGGLDSLAGALSLLQEGKNLILISHKSNNLGVSNIQDGILNRLITDYPGRIQFYPFQCHLSGERAVEETQRSRIFLYTAIAYSMMSLASEDAINVFENGITSLNFSKRQDAMNARSSRTTHPKTLNLLEDFYSIVAGKVITINHAFLYKTKSDILEIIKDNSRQNYLNSTLTCTKTFQKFKNTTNASHCGRCSQCVDRRLAMYATELEEYDAIYDVDISKDEIKDQEGFTHVHDYLYKLHQLNECTEHNFGYEYLDELTDILPHIREGSHHEKVQRIFNLTKEHVKRMSTAITRIRSKENILKPKKERTIFNILDSRSFLQDPSQIVAKMISDELSKKIPIAFQSQKPKSEKVLNDQIQVIVEGMEYGYSREYPVIKFGNAKTVPDHSVKTDLYIEGKYPRNKKSQSKLTDEVAADITKYGNAFKLFVIYDPEGTVVEKTQFKDKIESYPGCMVLFIV